MFMTQRILGWYASHHCGRSLPFSSAPVPGLVPGLVPGSYRRSLGPGERGLTRFTLESAAGSGDKAITAW